MVFWQPLTFDFLFRSSVRVLRDYALFSVPASLTMVALFGSVVGWHHAAIFSLAPVLAVAAFAGPIAASTARRNFRTRVTGLESFKVGLFAGAWALFWLAPFNVLVFAIHGTVLSEADNIVYSASLLGGGFLLSFLPPPR